MREILFRGKSEKGEWVQGVPFFEEERCYIIEDLFICDEYDCTGAVNSMVIPETIGQYTGLTDKYGKKVFEGDIIKTDNGRVSAISVVQYGKFEPKMFYDLIENYVRPRPTEKLYGLFAKSKCGEEMFLSESLHLIEIIGNIHDNPELVKEQQND